METFRLISMTDFVLEQWYPENLEGDEHAEVYQTIHNYAKFLKQPLTLGMFVPCDEEGNVLEEPDHYDEWIISDHYFEHSMSSYHLCRMYEQAVKHVLFNGVTIKEYDNEINISIQGRVVIIYSINKNSFINQEKHTIENLVKTNLRLTQSALKQIGL